MPAAVIGGAIAAVGSVGAAVIGSSGARSAANATQQAADTAAAVQRENYNRSAAALAPWQQSGLAANAQINALLGLPVQQQTAPTGNALTGSGTQVPRWVSRWGGQAVNDLGIGGSNFLGDNTVYGGAATATPALTPQQQAQNAFDIYRNSTGYQFRLNQGLNAVNSGYAGAGTLKSGAAMKAINDYGQGMATQEFGNYLGALGNQQQLGFGAASAQAGVGQNTANSLAQIYSNQGNNMANAALARSSNAANALNSVAGIGANIFGQMSQPSIYQRLAPSVSQTFAANGSIF